jgi:hypothetical protein
MGVRIVSMMKGVCMGMPQSARAMSSFMISLVPP